jgi:hypothetical protein
MDAGQIHLDAKIDVLKELLAEISEHQFTTVNQVNGLIQSDIELLNKTGAKFYPEVESYFSAKTVEVKL